MIRIFLYTCLSLSVFLLALTAIELASRQFWLPKYKAVDQDVFVEQKLEKLETK